MFKTKMKIIPYHHTPSECQNSIACYIRFSQETKKRADVSCRLGGVSIGLLMCLRKRQQKSNAVLFEFGVTADSLVGYCTYDMVVTMSQQATSLEPAREAPGGGSSYLPFHGRVYIIIIIFMSVCVILG